jgi:RNA polymerase sigma factor (sigma-70 family)
MDVAPASSLMVVDQNRQISDTVRRETGRLRAFIRRRVFNESDAEDILQDVLRELVDAYRLMQPLDEVSAWLFRVTRNRIIDLFRRRKTQAVATEAVIAADELEFPELHELLPSTEEGPDAAFARQALLEQLDEALNELPSEQREVFIAHELEGRSFKDLAAQWGVSLNTLLSRKRYAVLHLRRRLQAVYDEWIEE